ncbi:MAG TPA: hypothetical protein EYM39_13375 [Candidatus Latescibacteria bacterium]|nr:hypothetical protein [Candidatus Latescibacterota bacterium]
MDPITLIKPAIRDIGDFDVRRLLPAAVQRSVGPFVFWDHFGPVTLPAGQNRMCGRTRTSASVLRSTTLMFNSPGSRNSRN